MIYLTAIGFPPGGSSTVHIYTQTIHRITQFTNRKNADRAPSLRGIPWHLLTTEEKAGKNLSQGSRRMPVGTMKTEYTENVFVQINLK
jgi:hypothetical protein